MALRPTRTQLIVAGAVLALWLAGLVWFRPWIAHNDFAIFRIALERELDGHIRLVGAHSRLDVFHPGPLREWVFALPYWVSGRRTAALPATALVLNALWAIWILALARRLRPPAWGAACALGLLVLAIALGPDLASPWNPHLAILPLYLACWSAVSVVARRGEGWVACICASSFTAQLHASALVVGGALLALTLLVVVARRREVASMGIGLALVLWSGPIVDLRKGSGANLVRLATVGADGDSVGPSDAMGHVSRLLWPATPLGRVTVRPSVSEMTGFHRWWLLLILVALGALAAWWWRCRRSDADGPSEHDMPLVGAAVAGAVIVITVGSVALFVEPAFRYLYGPLQAGAVFAVAVVIGGVVAAVEQTVGREAPAWAPFARVVVPVGLVVVLVTVPRLDAPSEERGRLAVDPAVRSALDQRPSWQTVEVIPLDLRGAGDLDAEVLDVVLRSGHDGRSRRIELGLPAPVGVDGVFGVAMSPSRECLLDQQDVEEIVQGETAAGETVSIFAVESGSIADELCIGAARG